MSAGVYETAIETMRAALNVLQGPTTRSPVASQKETLKQLSDTIKTDASKVGVLWSDNGTPTDSEVAGMLDDLQKHVLLFCACCHGFTATAGPTLLADLKKMAGNVVGPCIELVMALEPSSKERRDLKPFVGKVWAACDSAKKLQVENKPCIFKHMANVVVVLKDIVRELDELLRVGDPEEQPQEDGTDDAGGDDDSIHDFKADALGGPELAVAEASRQLLGLALDACKQISKTLLEGPPVNAGEGLDEWESVVFHGRELRRAAEDLGAALYSPQEPNQVGGAAEALHNTLELMLEESPQAEGSAECQVLLQRCEEAAVRLQEAIRRLQEEQQAAGAPQETATPHLAVAQRAGSQAHAHIGVQGSGGEVPPEGEDSATASKGQGADGETGERTDAPAHGDVGVRGSRGEVRHDGHEGADSATASKGQGADGEAGGQTDATHADGAVGGGQQLGTAAAGQQGMGGGAAPGEAGAATVVQ